MNMTMNKLDFLVDFIIYDPLLSLKEYKLLNELQIYNDYNIVNMSKNQWLFC